MHRNFFPPDHRDCSKISISRDVDHDAVNVAISKRLTAQIKHGRVEIKQVGKTKLTSLRSGSAALAFCSRASYPITRESEMGDDFF